MSDDVDKILQERKNTHGSFEEYSKVMHDLQMAGHDYIHNVSIPQEQAINMIFSKIARILCGNPNELDHWVDIQGYARLAHDTTAKKNKVRDETESCSVEQAYKWLDESGV